MSKNFKKVYWWHYANFYQIWPKSFKDTNGDGIGDINGIIEKLDYIKYLGFNAIWVTPFYKSPMVDNGYDVEDYFEVNSIFGKNEDVEKLILECKKRELKIVIDMVFNHTSSNHFWFKEAKKSKENKYRDFYIWRDQPTKINSYFGGSAWELDTLSNQYYLHLFDKEQPDLNWKNPKVRQEMSKVLRKWKSKGVDGFRFDVLDLIGKEIDKNIFANGPMLHEYIRELIESSNLDDEIVKIGECWNADLSTINKYTSQENKELSMVFLFDHISILKDPKFRKYKYHKATTKALAENFVYKISDIIKNGWIASVFENHDVARLVDLFGDDDEYRFESAKTIALLQYSVPATPFVFQGQEIATKNYKCSKIDEFDDVEVIKKYKQYVLEEKSMTHQNFIDGVNKMGRDNARRPMHWDDSANFGFSISKPWFEQNFFDKNNVKSQMEDKNSVLNFYRKLNHLRDKQMFRDLLVNGKLVIKEHLDKDIIWFKCKNGDKEICYIGNFSSNKKSIKIDDLSSIILSTQEIIVNSQKITLEPWSAFIYN